MTEIDPRFATEDSGGGFSQPYEATTVDSFFQEGTYGWRLHFRNRLDHPELFPNLEGGEIVEQLSLPRGWVSTDGGKTVAHTDGPQKKFSGVSQVGILLSGNSGKAFYGTEAYHGLAGILTDPPADWSAYTSASYKGLHALWSPVTWGTRRPKRIPALDAAGTPLTDLEGRPQMVDVVGADGKPEWEEVTVERRMPVALLGAPGASQNGAVASVDLATLALPDDLLGALRAAAPAWTGHDNMVASIMGIDGALAHQPLAALVSDKGSFPGLKDALVAS